MKLCLAAFVGSALRQDRRCGHGGRRACEGHVQVRLTLFN